MGGISRECTRERWDKALATSAMKGWERGVAPGGWALTKEVGPTDWVLHPAILDGWSWTTFLSTTGGRLVEICPSPIFLLMYLPRGGSTKPVRTQRNLVFSWTEGSGGEKGNSNLRGEKEKTVGP